MEKTPHVLLAAEGAKKFAEENGIEPLPEGSLVTERALQALKKGRTLTEIAPTEVCFRRVPIFSINPFSIRENDVFLVY